MSDKVKTRETLKNIRFTPISPGLGVLVVVVIVVVVIVMHHYYHYYYYD